MRGNGYRRPYDLSDEASVFGYSEFEPCNEAEPISGGPGSTRCDDARLFSITTTAEASRRTAAAAAAAAAARPRKVVSAGPPKRDLMAMARVMNMTATLQTEQDTQEAQTKAAAEEEAERLRRERNAKWEAVKASMSARPTPLHTVRAYDSDWSDSEDEEDDAAAKAVSDVQSVRSVRSARTTASARSGRGTALDALVPTLAEERAMRAGPLYAVESVPQRFFHFLYNWCMYFVYALSSSMVLGGNSRKGNDPSEYYSRKRYA
ncbi:hypothetical protein N2W54_006945 [Lotmaria passim]